MGALFERERIQEDVKPEQGMKMQLRGYVDVIDRKGVIGWARDDDALDRSVSVVIIVNEAVDAIVVCDQRRADAASGDGRHGFRHEFATPIGENEIATVTVAFLETAALLTKGAGRVDPLIPTDETFIPVLVIGPGRSGTTLLMESFPAFAQYIRHARVSI